MNMMPMLKVIFGTNESDHQNEYDAIVKMLKVIFGQNVIREKQTMFNLQWLKAPRG